SGTPPHSKRAALLLLGGLLVLLALNLRLIFTSLSVLLPEITRALRLSSATPGYLTTLPVLCLGVFSPLAPICARRFGIERTLLGTLVLLAVGTALRGYVGISGLFVGSALAGGSIAVANVLLPALVKRDFAGHVALMTALYSAVMNVGSAAAAALTLPLTHALGGGWSVGVAMWAVPPAAVALLWLPQWRRKTAPGGPAEPHVRGLWRSALAWQVTLFMGLQSALAYCAAGWLAPILRSRGLDGTTAGLVTSVCMAMDVVGSLGVPFVVGRFKDQRFLNVAFSVLAGAPLLGLLFAPLSWAWVLAVLQGIGQGAMFSIALTVIVLRSPDAHVAAELSSMAQTVGYIIAAIGPLLVGVLLAHRRLRGIRLVVRGPRGGRCVERLGRRARPVRQGRCARHERAPQLTVTMHRGARARASRWESAAG
ncbi:MAG: CynX/NimT family MFS transporter, partial [Rhodanobacteraceae bacterium]